MHSHGAVQDGAFIPEVKWGSAPIDTAPADPHRTADAAMVMRKILMKWRFCTRYHLFPDTDDRVIVSGSSGPIIDILILFKERRDSPRLNTMHLQVNPFFHGLNIP